MNEQAAQEVANKIIEKIFGYKNPFTLEQFAQKFAFDIKLPIQVNDSTTGEVTWAQSTNPTKFMTLNNVRKRGEVDDWLLPKQPINDVTDILAIWNEVNYTSTERQLESTDVSKSDNVYNSQYVYNSQDVHFSKNILFCDAIRKSEETAASQRSHDCVQSMRIEDSDTCSRSFAVSWSGKISNSIFIHDSYDLSDCMFCSHIRSKRFCIANMQFEEEEYFKIKDLVVRWILTGK